MELIHLEEVRIINERLLERYGRDVNCDKAKFRLVYTDDQVETRYGEFDVYTGNIFLRQEKGVREIEKYRGYPPGTWMVERLMPNHHRDVMDGDYVYEPIYNFTLFPIWKACEFLIQSLFFTKPPRTEKEDLYLDDQKKIKEVAEARNMIDATVLGTTLADGSATSFANTKGTDYRPSQQGVEVSE